MHFEDNGKLSGECGCRSKGQNHYKIEAYRHKERQ